MSEVTPPSSGGSSTAPAGRISDADTSARPGRWTVISPSPFESSLRSNLGKLNGRGSPCVGRSPTTTDCSSLIGSASHAARHLGGRATGR